MKRGFTLIELLATIILIGLIGLIVIPNIMDIINKTSKKAFDSSIDGYIKAIKTDNLDRGGNENSYYIKNGDLFHAKTDEKIKVENTTKENGTITINKNGNIKGNIEDDKYCSLILNDYKSNDINKDECKLYEDASLNKADPVLDSDMIPVKIDSGGNALTVDLKEEWYNYEIQEWANIVIVNSEKLNKYKNASSSTIVENEDIIAYFVWIPRYKYKIPTNGTSTPSSIDIVFEDINTIKSIGNAKTEYFSHPAFTFGSQEINGFWAGKFETTGTKDKPTILPKQKPLDSVNIKESFEISRKFMKYNITSDSHMMKNTEWAAVAYLSHSKYGINKEVAVNRHEKLTSCGPSSDKYDEYCIRGFGSWYTVVEQSTSGNISGVFDMSGGYHERVMANVNFIFQSSGFGKLPDKKYYDLYSYDNNIYQVICDNNCLGQAFFETRNWYSDLNNTPTSDNPWVMRGASGSYGSLAGIFHVNTTSGTGSNTYGFRVTLS